MRRTLVILALALTAATAKATIIEIGQIDLTGDFTLNHTYYFSPGSPYGTFGELTVQSATGIFLPYVSVGDNLAMTTTALDPVALPTTWTIDGFTISTNEVSITGADFAGENVLGITSLSGNGFNPSAYPFGAYSYWNFTAPPYDVTNFPADITGPITLTIQVAYDNGHVPDGGNTMTLFAIAGVVLLGLSRKRKST